jgi:hypothetical protein
MHMPSPSFQPCPHHALKVSRAVHAHVHTAAGVPGHDTDVIANRMRTFIWHEWLRRKGGVSQLNNEQLSLVMCDLCSVTEQVSCAVQRDGAC